MTELLKAQTHPGIKPTLQFLRDKEGHEIDALIQSGPEAFHAVEIKSGETIASDFFTGLDYWRARLTRQTLTPWLIHGGIALQHRENATVLPWNDRNPLLNQLTRTSTARYDAIQSLDEAAAYLAHPILGQ